MRCDVSLQCLLFAIVSVTDICDCDLRLFDELQHSLNTVRCDASLIFSTFSFSSIDTERYFYDGEFGMPWNNEPIFGGPAPERLPAEWHNRDFLDMQVIVPPSITYPLAIFIASIFVCV